MTVNELACVIDGCPHNQCARGWCHTHYSRWRIHGDPHTVSRNAGRQPRPLAERLLARFEIDEATGCWRFTGSHIKSGYGNIAADGGRKVLRAHRAAYEVMVGPIPVGFEIDHVHAWGCRHRDCINPDHLEAVPPGENSRRANAIRWARRGA